MKKKAIFLAVLAALCVGVLTACSAAEAPIIEMVDGPDTAVCLFYGTVVELPSAKTMIVAPDAGSDILRSADRISLNTDELEFKPFVGDRVEVRYDGYVLETYPAMLSNYTVTKLPED